jgi:hypothetical protein
MREFVDSARTGTFVAGILASEIVAKLEATDHDLLEGWLWAQRVSFVREMISAIDRSTRSHARQTAARGVFAEAARHYEEGDATALDGYLNWPCTLADDVRKPLGALTRDELAYVRDDYQARANKNAFRATVFNAIMKRVTPGTTVADHYTNEQLAAIFETPAA